MSGQRGAAETLRDVAEVRAEHLLFSSSLFWGKPDCKFLRAGALPPFWRQEFAGDALPIAKMIRAHFKHFRCVFFLARQNSVGHGCYESSRIMIGMAAFVGVRDDNMGLNLREQ